MFPLKRNRAFAAEWDCQDGILIAWPHAGTDWAYMLDEVTACYVEMARAILNDDDLHILESLLRQAFEQFIDLIRTIIYGHYN